ncbi:PREDICTED: protein ENHANCED DISEASE RESISTANCE 4-like [Camelina sativa]|uniref:Protein ENHANCED DISEASE RESISTANCE 4-like n=1 Tax=Camelina sativa TaxID=90675 RepID=A0ABM0XU33_CAMSA|nr:PREDICTED: protein ENHANCED DISEASE RESISTANCE 4-like [Camelina sativa]
MASRTGQKIRLVKCPKCLKILQEDEDVPVYQCGGCSAILQAKRRNIAPNSTPSAVETERAQANEPPREPETNNVSSNSGQDTVLPSPIESTEKELGDLELSNGNETNEIQQQECSLGDDSEKNEGEDNSRLKSDMMNTMSEAAGSGASSGYLSVDHVVAGRASNSSGNVEISPDASPVEEKQSPLDYPANKTPSAYDLVAVKASNSSDNVEISPGASPVEEKQSPLDYPANKTPSAYDLVAGRASNSSGNAEISPDTSPVEDKQSQLDYPANKTSSAYDGSESSSEEMEDQLLDEDQQQWKTFQKIRSDKFEMPRYPGNYKEEGASSSSTFFDNRRNGITTYNERPQPNMSLQLERRGGRLGTQGRRHVTEQLRPEVPFYPREPYTRLSPSYPSHDEFDRYSRAHSLQMPPYGGGMNHEFVDYMYSNNPRARGRGQGSRISGEMASDRRNHPGWSSGQLHNSNYSSYSASPQRPMEQSEYQPRWSHEIVSDVEDHHQRNRHANHLHELQNRRFKERQRVAKRHVRPTAGGAPFVSCYRCSENLQLPVDFLIFKRKHHLLRCGTCTTVLRFSLQSRTHLVPAVTHDTDVHRSSSSTAESPRDGAPSQPEKLSSSVQDEELPAARGSPLHRLMGYSTVSQVFKASQRPPSV